MTHDPGVDLTVVVVIAVKVAQAPLSGTYLSGNCKMNCVFGPIVL